MNNPVKEVLLNIIDYMRFQVVNDKCSKAQMENLCDVIAENIVVDATISDLAKHFGQSESNIRNVASRSYLGKPKRRDYYNLMEFAKCIPAAWRKREQ